MNYYNENDPKAAAWLRELIKHGHIAAGEVDERSIADVKPGDLAGFVQCHFFAGIGIWSYALRLAGWPDDREVWTGSCPCQPFSAAGKQEGISDERHLWPEWFRLIKDCFPAVIFGEQVAASGVVGRPVTEAADVQQVRDRAAILSVLREFKRTSKIPVYAVLPEEFIQGEGGESRSSKGVILGMENEEQR